MKNIQYFLFAIILIFSACRKDEIKTDYNFDPTTGGETIETRFSGQVIDEAGLPLQGAVIRLAGVEKTSNEDGVFSFQNMKINEGGQLLTIEKNGFFTNIKRVTPIGNTTFQRVGLIAKGAPTGDFVSTDGGIISKSNGEKITFDANSIVDESGNEYNGTVEVFTHHFNPENPFLGEMMPGDLSGKNDEGNSVQLATYSMILAELYGESGQKLNLKSGSTAAVEFPIKGDAAANAPAEIPLWSLDELTGVWVEEGLATRDGNYYKGEVSHFSFWNCDDDFDLVNLEGQVLDQDGNPVANSVISLEMVNGGMVRSNTTNIEGRFRGGVPINEELILSILNQCGGVAYTETIGPFDSDAQISITINDTSDFLTLSGSLKDCNGDPVTQGNVVAKSDSGIKYIISVDANGDFSSSFPVCPTSEFSVYGVNIAEMSRSAEVIVTYTGQPSEVIGLLQTCDTLDEFIAMTFGGNDYFLAEAENVILEPEQLRITANYSPLGSPYFSMDIKKPQLGMNIPHRVSVGNMDLSLRFGCAETSPVGGPPPTPCTGNITVEITQLDDFIGGFIVGVVEGQLWNELGTLEDVSIDFKVEVDFKLIEIGGRVWDDLNENGIQDAGEPGIPDVGLASVVYFNAPGNGAYSYGAQTDADGNYTTLMTLDKPGKINMFHFANLGVYTITLQGQGPDPTKDSDFDPITNIAENVIAVEGAVNQYDCGAHLK